MMPLRPIRALAVTPGTDSCSMPWPIMTIAASALALISASDIVSVRPPIRGGNVRRVGGRVRGIQQRVERNAGHVRVGERHAAGAGRHITAVDAGHAVIGATKNTGNVRRCGGAGACSRLAS